MNNFSLPVFNFKHFFKKCVEYYDSVKDPIKFYFLEKIQITLASKASLKIMVLNKRNELRRRNSKKSMKKLHVAVIF